MLIFKFDTYSTQLEMELNSKIWIPCEQNVWVRGTLLDHLDEDLVRVETESGVVTISKSKVAKIAGRS